MSSTSKMQIQLTLFSLTFSPLLSMQGIELMPYAFNESASRRITWKWKEWSKGNRAWTRRDLTENDRWWEERGNSTADWRERREQHIRTKSPKALEKGLNRHKPKQDREHVNWRESEGTDRRGPHWRALEKETARGNAHFPRECWE